MMKNITKRISALVLATLLCGLLFTGCGKKEDGKVTDPSNHGNAASDISKGASDVGNDLSKGASDVGDDLSKGASDVGDAASKVGDGVSKGASEAGDMASKAGDDISRVLD